MNEEAENEKVERLRRTIEKARELYSLKSEIWCPYFSLPVTFNSEGFNHLLNKKNRIPRNIDEQLLKLHLLPKALLIISKAGTLQEYRCVIEKTGERRSDGFYKMSEVQYWGFHAILETLTKKIKIVVVIKKIGDGKLIFWSVLPYRRLSRQKLFSSNIDEE